MGPAAIVDELDRDSVYALDSLLRGGSPCDRARIKTSFRRNCLGQRKPGSMGFVVKCAVI